MPKLNTWRFYIKCFELLVSLEKLRSPDYMGLCCPETVIRLPPPLPRVLAFYILAAPNTGVDFKYIYNIV
jgi:hypothetical protein